ncbi:MAG: hypothetical protein J1E64_04345 [Acetatifactor sp.]|nr:hypothetical protein [Acetatifactor sp.]
MKKRKIKPVFVNYITIMIMVGIIFIFVALVELFIKLELLNMGTGLLTGGEGVELGKFILILIYIFFVFIPSSYSLFLTILSSVALCIYKPMGKRLLIYRILMSIVYVAIALLAYGILMLFGKNLFLNVISVVAEIGLVTVLGINIWNTYSGRIREKKTIM